MWWVSLNNVNLLENQYFCLYQKNEKPKSVTLSRHNEKHAATNAMWCTGIVMMLKI
jgi:hypothetical protein